MNFGTNQHIHFIGIGGIGMSALARYFHRRGHRVTGYDRSPSALTLALEKEGMLIHYTDKPGLLSPDTALVVYTPAVPPDLGELRKARETGIRVMKRSEVLGGISETYRCLSVAGSHGKTSTSAMLAHLLRQEGWPILAFLGGISLNYRSNLIDDPDAKVMVAEADEYDRSFLHLSPDLVIITAIDSDHLDIYGTHASLLDAFSTFAGKLSKGEILLIKEGLQNSLRLPAQARVYTYGWEQNAGFRPVNVQNTGNGHAFDLETPDTIINGLHLSVPGLVQVENAVAATAAALLTGLDADACRRGLQSFLGVSRRLEKRFEHAGMIYYDDYAHHPEELKACIRSLQMLHPGRKITGIFQPHLYTRTRDLAEGFAESLAALDEIILLEIYPAREAPIAGINAAFLLEKISSDAKSVCDKEALFNLLDKRQPEILVTLGAGDIDQLADPIVHYLSNRYK
ncbi:MAG TPA: UDP-N-acetylmuramate--L-alanine ligase [Bacteroidales bacterium]|nr:UDP-N-acetylmuramate--L-alanine ligase [Bacteroidales bacterium]HSA44387.1 UDP-N-acetylmuramate--L-alanine ligase [Bacteroidales bacterium]